MRRVPLSVNPGFSGRTPRRRTHGSPSYFHITSRASAAGATSAVLVAQSGLAGDATSDRQPFARAETARHFSCAILKSDERLLCSSSSAHTVSCNTAGSLMSHRLGSPGARRQWGSWQGDDAAVPSAGASRVVCAKSWLGSEGYQRLSRLPGRAGLLTIFGKRRERLVPWRCHGSAPFRISRNLTRRVAQRTGASAARLHVGRACRRRRLPARLTAQVQR